MDEPGGAQPDHHGGWSSQVDELMVRWWRRVKAVEAGHYRMADHLSRSNIRLGIPVVVLSTLIGTSVFATLQKQVNFPVRVLVGVLSLVAAVLASLQTFLRYAERAEKHRHAAGLYSSLRREMEKLLALSWEERGPAADHMDRLRTAMDRYGNEAPEIGERVWESVRQQFDLDEPAPIRRMHLRPRKSRPRPSESPPHVAARDRSTEPAISKG